MVVKSHMDEGKIIQNYMKLFPGLQESRSFAFYLLTGFYRGISAIGIVEELIFRGGILTGFLLRLTALKSGVGDCSFNHRRFRSFEALLAHTQHQYAAHKNHADLHQAD